MTHKYRILGRDSFQGDSELLRRDFLKLMGTMGIVAAGGAACSQMGQPSAEPTEPMELNIGVWDSTFLPIVERLAYAPFREAHPEVTITLFDAYNAQDYAKLLAAKENPPPPIDASCWNDSWAARGAEEGMWLQIDKANVPNSAYVAEELNPAYGLGITFGVTPFGIAYSPEYVDPPTSWTDLYDPKYKGKVALWDVFFDWLLMAARVEGGDEYDLEPGIRAWEKAKENIGMWVGSLPLLHEALDRGEIWLAADWASFCLGAKRQGKSVDFALPSEGATQASEIFMLHSGISPEAKALTEEFFNYFLTIEFQTEQLENTFYSPSRRDVEIPEDLRSSGTISTKEALEKLIQYDYGYVGSHFDDIKESVDKTLK